MPALAQDLTAEQTAAPRIEIEGSEIDIGQVIRGEAAEGSFTVRNTGSSSLQILRVKPG